MTIYSSARPHATAIWRITGSCGPTTPRFRKRSLPAHRSNCAMPQRRRAICCSGHAACIFATSLVPATSASPARAVRRLPAQIACWPFWVLATHALLTNPSDMAVAMMVYDAVVHVLGRLQVSGRYPPCGLLCSARG